MNISFIPGIFRLCMTILYIIIVISDHVSFGSHPQYLPHDSFAQTAPRKVPIVRKYSPRVRVL